jgi:hypothetical protein
MRDCLDAGLPDCNIARKHPVSIGGAPDFKAEPSRMHWILSSGRICGSLHVTERDQSSAAFIPQNQSHTAEALHQRQASNHTELRIVAQYTRQPIERDSAAEMVHVVHSDVRSNPTQDAG